MIEIKDKEIAKRDEEIVTKNRKLAHQSQQLVVIECNLSVPYVAIYNVY